MARAKAALDARPAGAAGQLTPLGEAPGADHASKRRSAWVLLTGAGLLIALWAVVLVGLSPVFRLNTWLWWALAIVAATVLVSALLATVSRPRLIHSIVGACAGLLVLLGHGITGGGLRSWLREPAVTANELWLAIDRGAAPLAVGDALEGVLLVAVWILSALTTFVLVGRGAFLAAGTIVALLLLIPVAVTGFATPGLALFAAGVLLTLLAWAASPSPHPVGLVSAVAAVAVAASALAFVPATRDRVWNRAVVFSPVSVTVPDVTVALAEDLRERSETIAFRVSGAEPGAYRFTLATLSDFDDGTWLPQEELNSAGLTVDDAIAPWLLTPTDTSIDSVMSSPSMTVTIEGLRSSWLPLPQHVFSVLYVERDGGFDPSEWIWSAEASTARSEQAMTRTGDVYVVAAQPQISEWVRTTYGERRLDMFESFDLSLIADTAQVDEQLAQYLELPGVVPDEISSQARAFTAGAGDRMAAAIALEAAFRSGDFAYDEAAPYDPSLDPDDPYSVMVALLDERRGYCVHYASTFAVMARDLGIPTRLAVGYAARSTSLGSSVQVSGGDLHAWPEIFIEDIGWIAFEPTPGGAGVRADSEREVSETQNEETSAAPETTTAPEMPEEQEAAEALEQEVDLGTTGDSATTDDQPTPWWALAAAGVLVLLALVAPALWRRGVAVRRARAIARGDRPAERAWAEFVDTATDLGLPRPGDPPRAGTPEALVEYLASRGLLDEGAAAAALAIAGTMQVERYSEGGSPVPAGDSRELTSQLRAARRGLAASASFWGRIGAALLPRSVFGRARAQLTRSSAPTYEPST